MPIETFAPPVSSPANSAANSAANSPSHCPADATSSEAAPSDPLANAAEVRSQVWSVLGGLGRRPAALERRRDERFPFPRPLRVTPTDDEGRPVDEPLMAAGKQISERGLGFFHAQPLPHRSVAVALERRDGTSVSFLLRLRWCRFLGHGLYESGGYFLRTTSDAGRPQIEE